MKSLKMLPWLARKAGISEGRAEELWIEAIQFATHNAGWVGTSEYWKYAMNRLLELIERERIATRGQSTPRRLVFPLVAQCKEGSFDADTRLPALRTRVGLASDFGGLAPGFVH